MSIKKCLFNFAIAAGAFTLAACSDYDNGYEENMLAYQRNFEDVFGKIDPNATWNATHHGSVLVDAKEQTQVMVYAQGLGVNLQLRCDVVNAGESKEIHYDAPQGVTKVSIVSKTLKSWNSTTVDVAEKVPVSLASAKPKRVAPNNPYDYGKAHPISYVENFYTMNDDGTYGSVVSYDKALQSGITNYWSTSEPNGYSKLLTISKNDYSVEGGEWGTWYAAYPWAYTQTETINNFELAQRKDNKKIDSPKENITLPTELTQAIINVVGTADDKIEVLKPYTQDLNYMTTTEPGQVEITSIKTQTNSNNYIGYYYTTGEQTADQLKAVKKFILIPNMEQCQPGDKYKLVYFGSNYDQVGTFDFPKNVQIHFFLGRAGGSQLNTFNVKECVVNTAQNAEHTGYITKTLTDVYGMSMNHVYFSDSELNYVEKAHDFTTFNFPATAAFSVMGRNCISFEDWPSTGSIDWNDAVFAIDAPFSEFKSFDEVQYFYVAMEDLGNTDDFDFNDVVLRLKQTTTTIKASEQATPEVHVSPATVELLAAGGTMPISVKYDTNGDGDWSPEDDDLFSEVHSAFGVNVSDMVNTGRGPVKPVVKVEWPDEHATLNITDFAQKLLFCVNNNKSGEAYYTITIPKTTGEVPQAFIIPGTASWQWPFERQSIVDLYDNFDEWVQNNSDASAQYWYNYQWGKTYGSVTPPVDPADPGEGGSFVPVIETFTTFSAQGQLDLSEYFTEGATSATLELVVNNDSGYIWLSDIGVYVGNNWAFNMTGLGTVGTYSFDFTSQQVHDAIQGGCYLKFGDGVVGLASIKLTIE